MTDHPLSTRPAGPGTTTRAASAHGPVATQAPTPSPLVRLPPHHKVLRRAPDAVQIGVLPGRAIEVAGLSPPCLALLLDLHGSWPLDDLVARAVELGAGEAEARALLEELLRTGGLVDAAAPRRTDRTRGSSTVLVAGAGPLLGAVVGGLAAAGVGGLYVDTDGVALAEEFAPLPPARPGETRLDAVLAQARRLAPASRVRAGVPRHRPHLAVFTDSLAPDPARHRRLVERGVAQLIVRLVDGLGVVGPLVLPGRSACLRCIDLRHAGHDPCWPLVAAGLAGSSGSASPATVAATAALAVEQALLALDPTMAADPPPTLDGTLELDPSRGTVRRRVWPPHPDCGCGAPHNQPDRPAAAALTSHGDP